MMYGCPSAGREGAEGVIVGSGLLFAVLPIAFGVALLGIGWRILRSGRARRGWATAPGLIEASSVRSREVKVPLLGRKTLRTSGITFGDGPRITYAFEVEGETYRGTRIGTPPARRKSRARRPGEMWDLAPFEAGRPVTVHYDPADPADCILYPTPTRPMALSMMALGVTFVLFGAMALSILRGL